MTCAQAPLPTTFVHVVSDVVIVKGMNGPTVWACVHVLRSACCAVVALALTLTQLRAYASSLFMLVFPSPLRPPCASAWGLMILFEAWPKFPILTPHLTRDAPTVCI